MTRESLPKWLMCPNDKRLTRRRKIEKVLTARCAGRSPILRDPGYLFEPPAATSHTPSRHSNSGNWATTLSTRHVVEKNTLHTNFFLVAAQIKRRKTVKIVGILLHLHGENSHLGRVDFEVKIEARCHQNRPKDEGLNCSPIGVRAIKTPAT